MTLENSKYFLIYQYIKKYKCDLFSNKINYSKDLSQILKTIMFIFLT